MTLITGGAGFVGSHLAEHLCRQGWSVLLIDDLSTGRAENIEHLPAGQCRLIRGRLGQVLREQPGVLEGVERIFHLAASVGVRLAVEQPLATIRNNVRETEALLQAAAQRRTPLLLASSSEVYGKAPSQPLREDDDLVLGPTTSPRWSYALSKALDEHLALGYGTEHGLPVVIVRLFNIIGPRQRGEYGMVVPRFVERALAGQDLVIHGDGTQRRCFCDVRDAVRAMAQLLDRPEHQGQVFNVGSDQEISINELADLVIELSRAAVGKRFVPYDQAYSRTLEDPARRVPDLRKLQNALAFQPIYSLKRTIGDLIELARRETPTGAICDLAD